MKLTSLMGNAQKLDGGAMFGNAPKALWQRWLEPDEQNRIPLACRALLIEVGTHKILFETGIGAYMAPKFRSRYGVLSEKHVLLESLQKLDLGHEDITAVILSHLHFDHAGGLLSAYQESLAPELLFPNAAIYVGQHSWERACNPHPRDRASFIPELEVLLKNSGRLKVVGSEDRLSFDNLNVRFIESSGHTPGMLLANIQMGTERLVFGADLIPGAPWVHLPITMGYDRFPELLIDEKRLVLEELVADGGWLFFTHDPCVAMAKIEKHPEKGTFQPVNQQNELVRYSFGV